MIRARAGLLAGIVAWPASALALAGSAQHAVPLLISGIAGIDEACAAVASVAGLAVLAWLALAVLTSALAAALTGAGRASEIAERLATAITPAVLRRFIALAVAGALASGAAPAHAAMVPGERPAAVAAGPVTAGPVTARPITAGPVTAGPITAGPVTAGPFSDRPVPAAWPAPAGADPLDPGWAVIAEPAPAPAPAAARPMAALDPSWGSPSRARTAVYPDDAVVVRRGDTLWDIAARHLGAAATDAEIAHAWPAWFAANRAMIGPDPDRLVPGQRLHPPTARIGGHR